MTKAAPSKTKKQRHPTCPHCKKRFRTTSAIKAYCNTACQKEATKLKRRVSYTHRATNSGFFYWIAAECERAGTLQILACHTVESLVDLHTVYKLSLKANKYGDIKISEPGFFEVSHICAVKAKHTIGLLHPANLVVAPQALNRAHGTKHYGHGLSISRADLHPRFSVDKGSNRKTTIERAIKFLGETLVSEAVRIGKIQATQRHKTLSWLHDNLDTSNPVHRAHLETIDTMSGKLLNALKAEVQGKQPTGYKVKSQNLSPLRVLMLELERHTAYRPDLAVIARLITKRVPEHLITFASRPLVSEGELQTLFDVLHGRSVEDVQEAFYIIDNGERIPPYAPIRFNVPAPVRVLKTFTSFSDELDGYVPDVAPALLQGHTGMYEVEPLPWD
ncbi:hypothetical protein [Pseudomonas syringae]|uniref:hypothetical protein n=1 Tax=Pseudomonas syringae TaxID=317 RepID=UPI0018E63707|nr:hypothetical protein [Pseudomonas syringae]MBI6799330.1 hypothetical protein [Pseudomonas syringae]